MILHFQIAVVELIVDSNDLWTQPFKDDPYLSDNFEFDVNFDRAGD